MERTLLIVKPDGVQRQLVGEILGRFERRGLSIVGLKMLTIDLDLATRHYEVHQGKPFYDSLVKFMTSGPTVAFVLEGVSAISICRKMVGATFGPDAEPGTIRGDFGLSRSFNLIHASDSTEAVNHEIGLFFAPNELQSGEPHSRRWIYDTEDLALSS